MKRLLAMVIGGAVLATASFQAQTGQPAAATTNMEILRQKIKSDKKLVIAANMKLSDAEGKSFWPVYDAYQKDLSALNTRTVKLVADYATAYNAGPIASATAKTLLTEMLAIEDAEVQLRKSYLPKFESALPAEKVARYLQIENKIRAVVKYELAAAIPLVD